MPEVRCSGPIARREFLQAGALALSGLTLADVLAGRALAGESRRDTAVILLYLHGGPSQLETYDLKPDAPVEYRSLYHPIATNVPGMEICELLPLQAKLADKIALVRSMHHTVGIHSDGGIVVTTGKMPSKLDPTSTSKSEHPDFGMIAGKVRGPHPEALPPYVSFPNKLYFTLPTYLGLHHGAFEGGDPSQATYAPPSMRIAAGKDIQGLEDRKSLIAQFDRLRRDLSPQLAGTDEFRERAFAMLTSRTAADAFDIAREPAELRDRYGRHHWGQTCLLARRLAEAGTAVVSVQMNSPINSPDYTNWDDHIQNAMRPGHFGMYMSRRLPFLDQALSALIEDIHAKGLEQRILVMVMGEFGRTPRLSHNANGTGRDHWPDAYTVLLSGGGLKMGQVIGGTNSKSEYPTERPLTPYDLLATVYRHLGIDTTLSFNDFAGRPIPILSEGTPIRELV